MFDPARIPALHDLATSSWHEDASPSNALPGASDQALEALVLRQHRANFDLWHCEDAARDPDASDATIAQTKRSIDRLNQHRNDLVEEIDHVLLALVHQQPSAPLHSETPGLIIDRLSILSLKLFHTEEQIARTDVAEDHIRRNRERLHLLERQRDDLALCLRTLWYEVQCGQRRFKLYRQLKMYNDPSLNPVLYRERALCQGANAKSG